MSDHRQPTLYTIGHSNQQADELLAALHAFAISTVVDVRSVPFSQYTPCLLYTSPSPRDS